MDYNTLKDQRLERPVPVTLPLVTWLNIINAMKVAANVKITLTNEGNVRQLAELVRRLDEHVADALTSPAGSVQTTG